MTKSGQPIGHWQKYTDKKISSFGDPMTITRIGEMKAQKGQEAALRAFFDTVIVPAVKTSAGIQSCYLLQNRAEPTRFIFIELWDSIEAHQASVKNIDPRQIENVMKLLADTPKGEYFSDNGVA
jgi:quinol monooxygenase YgiN